MAIRTRKRYRGKSRGHMRAITRMAGYEINKDTNQFIKTGLHYLHTDDILALIAIETAVAIMLGRTETYTR